MADRRSRRGLSDTQDDGVEPARREAGNVRLEDEARHALDGTSRRRGPKQRFPYCFESTANRAASSERVRTCDLR